MLNVVKVVVAGCEEFALSGLALDWLREKGVPEIELKDWRDGNIPRHHELLVELVEEFTEKYHGISSFEYEKALGSYLTIEELKSDRYQVVKEPIPWEYGGGVMETIQLLP